MVKQLLLSFWIVFFTFFTTNQFADSKKKTILIGIPSFNRYPFFYTSADSSKFEGSDFEMCNQLIEKIGCDVKFVKYKSLKEGRNLLRNKNIDVLIGGVYEDLNYANEFLFSKAYYTGDINLIYRRNDYAKRDIFHTNIDEIFKVSSEAQMIDYSPLSFLLSKSKIHSSSVLSSTEQAYKILAKQDALVIIDSFMTAEMLNTSAAFIIDFGIIPLNHSFKTVLYFHWDNRELKTLFDILIEMKNSSI